MLLQELILPCQPVELLRDVTATGGPALLRFVFAFIFAIGLVFVLIFNGERHVPDRGALLW